MEHRRFNEFIGGEVYRKRGYLSETVQTRDARGVSCQWNENQGRATSNLSVINSFER